jgi:hypothetical protein
VFAVLPIVALATIYTGCGSSKTPTAEVSGKVTYQGKPLAAGAVLFQPASGPAAKGEISPDGSFRLSTFGSHDGAILGTHKVGISCYAPAAAKSPSQEPGLGKPLIPEKYLNFQTSGLTAEVTSDANHFEFELK